MPHIIKRPAQTELVIKRSRFIARTFVVTSPEQAGAQLESIRKQHWDATHNCYAYVLGFGQGVQKFSDDGEPGGTAGMPMLEVLRAREMTDVLVVVTRYFGGIQLGAGGLVRAYSKVVAQALDASGSLNLEPGVQLTFCLAYDQYAALDKLLRETGCVVQDAQFTDCVTVIALVRVSSVDALEAACVDITGGKVSIQRGEVRPCGWEMQD